MEAEKVWNTARSPSWTGGQVLRPGTHEGLKLRTEGKKPLHQQLKDEKADLDGEPREGEEEAMWTRALKSSPEERRVCWKLLF